MTGAKNQTTPHFVILVVRGFYGNSLLNLTTKILHAENNISQIKLLETLEIKRHEHSVNLLNDQSKQFTTPKFLLIPL